MPELPEVETIIRDLNKKVLKRTFIDVWTDFPKTIKFPSLDKFEEKIKHKTINKISRIGKNIIFDLSGGLTLLIHQKMTGHLLLGVWNFESGAWIPKIKGVMEEKVNDYIHLMFYLDDGKMLALSDLRKFAKVLLVETEKLGELKDVKDIGPDPTDKSFIFEKFKDVFKGKRGKIKKVLMDQNVIAGIGNIYSDEILWEARIYPLRDIQSLEEKEIKAIYRATKKVLSKAIGLRGTSISDFRDISGEEGFYAKYRKVYQREGELCPRGDGKIKRIKLGGRSAHYCPNCQK